MPDVSSKVPLPGMVSACERAGTHARASTEPSGVSEPVQGERNEKKSLLSFLTLCRDVRSLGAMPAWREGLTLKVRSTGESERGGTTV